MDNPFAGMLNKLIREQVAPVIKSAVSVVVTRAQTIRKVVVSNVGAAGAVTFTLPPATTPGQEVRAIVKAAQVLRVKPNGTETMALPSTGVQGAAGKGMEADAVGESGIWVVVVPGTWDYLGPADGTWTAEA